MAKKERSIKELRELAAGIQPRKTLNLTKPECDALFLKMDQLMYVLNKAEALAFAVKSEALFRQLLKLQKASNMLIGYAIKAKRGL